MKNEEELICDMICNILNYKIYWTTTYFNRTYSFWGTVQKNIFIEIMLSSDPYIRLACNRHCHQTFSIPLSDPNFADNIIKARRTLDECPL